MTKLPAPRLIAIAGGSASGKSQLAGWLVQQLPAHCVLLSQDWYYRDRSGLSPAQKSALNFDHPKAFDAALLRRHLRALKAGKPVAAPRYDYATQSRLPSAVPVAAAPIIVLEGLLVLHDPQLRALLDFSVFIDVPADIRLLRRLRRDAAARGLPPQETLRLYEHCVRPMHENFVQPSARHADVIWHGLADQRFPQRLLRQLKAMLKPASAGPAATR